MSQMSDLNRLFNWVTDRVRYEASSSTLSHLRRGEGNSSGFIKKEWEKFGGGESNPTTIEWQITLGDATNWNGTRENILTRMLLPMR